MSTVFIIIAAVWFAHITGPLVDRILDNIKKG